MSMRACMFYSFFVSYFCYFSMQYVLQMEAFVKSDDEGNHVLPVVYSPFVLEDAVKQFNVFVSDNENLLDAKLVRPLFSVIYFLVCCISFCSYFLEKWS